MEQTFACIKGETGPFAQMPALREGYLNIGDPLETAELAGAISCCPSCP